MLLIAVTDWKAKVSVFVRLLLFLLLLWLVTPQFVAMVTGCISEMTRGRSVSSPPAVRVEQPVAPVKPETAKDQGEFLKMLQQYYTGSA